MQTALYIHIPFCVRKCAYCDFLSGPASAEEQEKYLTSLLEEIRLTGRLLQKDWKEKIEVTSIFIGGGTPSLPDAIWIKKILDMVREQFALLPDAEITMEMNPGTVTAEKIAIYRKAGINRLSIGLQSTDNAELKQLGRIHTWETFLHTWDMVRAAGFQNVNIDLMSALPGQTVDSWKRTLEQVIALQPEHISAYSLIIEEGTPFYERYGEDVKEQSEYPPLPGEDADRQMYALTGRILAENGYHRYEISNYAKPGYACRHNLRYWQGGNYLGFGIGAASLWEQTRYSNTSDRERYEQILNQEKNLDALREDVEHLTVQAQMEEFMFLGLRCMNGIETKQFEEQFGQKIEKVYGEVLKRLQEERVLVWKDGRIALTEYGIDVSNAVLAEFLL